MKNLAFGSVPIATLQALGRGLMVLFTVFYLQPAYSDPPLSGDKQRSVAKQAGGKSLSRALQQRRSLNVSGAMLGNVVEDLQRHTGICVCVDRRTNPSARVDLKTEYITTKEIFKPLAATSDAVVSFCDDFVFIGPEKSTSRLRTLMQLRRQDVHQLRRKMDTEKYRRLVDVEKRSWPDLAEPRELLLAAAAKADVQLENADAVPHDLWRGLTLPAMSFADFATLVLHQFDLTFELSATGRLKFIPVAKVIEIEERHRVSSREKERFAQRWAARFPDLNVSWKGSTATVSATVEVHEQLREIVAGKSGESVDVAGIRSRLFTMKAAQGTAFGSLIVSLRKSGVPIRVEGKTDAELGPLLRETVAFDIAKLPGDEFFPEIFDGWGAEVVVGDEEVVLTFP